MRSIIAPGLKEAQHQLGGSHWNRLGAFAFLSADALNKPLPNRCVLAFKQNLYQSVTSILRVNSA